jgi:hypothetical protein
MRNSPLLIAAAAVTADPWRVVACLEPDQMPQPTSHSHHPPKWAVGLRREMQTAIGRQLRVECELPQELAPELTMLLIRMDEESEQPTSMPHTAGQNEGSAERLS